MFTSARLRLTAWYVAVLVTIVFVAGLVTYLTLARSLRTEADGSLRDRSRTEVQRLQDGGFADHVDGDDAAPVVTPVPTSSPPTYDPGTADILVFVTDAAGAMVRGPTPPFTGGLPSTTLIEHAGASGGSQITNLDLGDARFRVMTVPLLRDGTVVGFLQLAKSEEQHDAELRQLRNVLGSVAGAGVFLAAVGGYILTGRTLSPIRLALQRQRDFVADASHELRTPLTVIRANAEVALLTHGEEQRELLQDSIQEVDQMAALVSDLLTIARIDSGTLAVAADPVDLSTVAADVCRGVEKIAEEGGRTLDTKIEPGVIVEGDQVRLRQLLTILTDNAIRYNREGGSVTVLVTRERDRAMLVVRDTGVGIPAEALPRVFDRFYRVDPARSSKASGTGLGLSIARWIVDAHRGRLRIESAQGVGTAVFASLPLARA